MSILPNFLHRLNANLLEITASYSVVINTLSLKFTQRDKRPRVANTTQKKNDKVGGLTLPNFKTYAKATAVNTVWHWQKSGRPGHWNRTQNPEIDPHKPMQLMFDRGAKATQCRMDGEQLTATCKKRTWTQIIHFLQNLTQNDHRPKNKIQYYKIPRKKYKKKPM